MKWPQYEGCKSLSDIDWIILPSFQHQGYTLTWIQTKLLTYLITAVCMPFWHHFSPNLRMRSNV